MLMAVGISKHLIRTLNSCRWLKASFCRVVSIVPASRPFTFQRFTHKPTANALATVRVTSVINRMWKVQCRLFAFVSALLIIQVNILSSLEET